MTVDDICSEIGKYPAQLVVLTGGEPSLFVDKALCDAIHTLGKTIAMETNGTQPVSVPIDHITCSPKFEFNQIPAAQLQISHIDELKVVFTGKNDMSLYDGIIADNYYLQPCDTGRVEDTRQIVRQTLDYVLQHPKWKLSLQLHKILQVR